LRSDLRYPLSVSRAGPAEGNGLAFCADRRQPVVIVACVKRKAVRM
jgi:hypothetical protein